MLYVRWHSEVPDTCLTPFLSHHLITFPAIAVSNLNLYPWHLDSVLLVKGIASKPNIKGLILWYILTFSVGSLHLSTAFFPACVATSFPISAAAAPIADPTAEK